MLELFYFFFFQTDRCVLFQRRSWRWDCQCLSWTEKEGGGQKWTEGPQSQISEGRCLLASLHLSSSRPGVLKQGEKPLKLRSDWFVRMLAGDFLKFFLNSIFTSSHLSPAAGPRGLPSSGSGRSATGSPCGAILWSLPIGWSAGGPGRPQTASGGCRRCRRHRLR